jgi:DNA-binding MarR family transcriptional regulator
MQMQFISIELYLLFFLSRKGQKAKNPSIISVISTSCKISSPLYHIIVALYSYYVIQLLQEEIIMNIGQPFQLRENIRQLERKLGILQDNQQACCCISMAQCHALVEIGRAKSISLNELSKKLNVDNSTTSRAVNKLVIGNLVKRDIDPNDRRYVTIALTEHGEEVFLNIESDKNTYFKQVYDSIPESKREQVVESLRILIEAITANQTNEE